MKRPQGALLRYEIQEDSQLLPTLIGSVPAGSPATLFEEMEMVNLKHLLTHDAPDAWLLRVHGFSMSDEVEDGDWVIASPSLEPEKGNIVVASIAGELTLKEFQLTDRKERRTLRLVPKNPEYPVKEYTYEDDVEILAVVTRIIKNRRHR